MRNWCTHEKVRTELISTTDVSLGVS